MSERGRLGKTNFELMNWYRDEVRETLASRNACTTFPLTEPILQLSLPHRRSLLCLSRRQDEEEDEDGGDDDDDDGGAVVGATQKETDAFSLQY